MILLLIFVLGTLVGSFLNALIYRIPRGRDIVFERSRCPHCRYKIQWYYNIPLLSYLFLRGKCHSCGKGISPRYPGVELFTALATVLLFPSSMGRAELVYFLFNAVVLYTFILIFFIDIDFKIIPNALNLCLGVFFLVFSSLNFHYGHILLGLLLGGGFPLMITWLFYLWKGQVGLGGGDIKLFAVLGIYLGPLEVMRTVFFSCFFGSLVILIFMMLKKMDRKTKIPFGPFIVVVASFQIFMSELYRQMMTVLF